MSPLLIALLATLLIPLFVATWRTSLLGLALQGLLSAWIAYRIDPALTQHGEGWLTLFDLGVIRGLFAPLVLYRVLHENSTPARNDVIPPNLLSWTLALAVALVSFNVAENLVQQPGDERTLVAVAAAGLMLGFLVLASQSGAFSQMIGALRIENAIALAELSGRQRALPVALHAGLTLVVVVSVSLFAWYLARLSNAPSDAGTPEEAVL